MTKAKSTVRKKAPEPTREEYRDWYWREQRTSNELRTELRLARATIEAQAYALAYRAPRGGAEDDIPF